MMQVHTRDTLTYACMLVGQFFHTVPPPPFSWSSVSASVPPPLPSRNSCMTEAPPAPLPVPSSFPLVEKEQINRTNKTGFLVHACVNISSSVLIVRAPAQVFHIFPNNFGSNLLRRSSPLVLVRQKKKKTKRQKDNDHEVPGSVVIQPVALFHETLVSSYCQGFYVGGIFMRNSHPLLVVKRLKWNYVALIFRFSSSVLVSSGAAWHQ